MEKLVFSLSEYRRLRYGRQTLTPTLVEILQKIADGWTGPAIAEDRGRAVDTVKHQCMQIRDVLGAETISQAVAMGIRRGLIQ